MNNSFSNPGIDQGEYHRVEAPASIVWRDSFNFHLKNIEGSSVRSAKDYADVCFKSYLQSMEELGI